MQEITTEVSQSADIQKSLQDYLGVKPSAVYLISPGVAKGEDGLYRSTTMLGKDHLRGGYGGYIGGILRVWAVADVYKFFPQNTQVITSSISPAGERTGLVETVSHAEVQEKELRRVWEKRGVIPPTTILKQENSFNTITELAELVMLIVESNWNGTVVAVSNDYHTKRIARMLERLPSLLDPTKPEYARYKDFAEVWEKFKAKEQQGVVNVVVKGAESILKLTDPKFKHALDNAFSQDPWKSALELRELVEERGVEALDTGSYSSKPLIIKS